MVEIKNSMWPNVIIMTINIIEVNILFAIHFNVYFFFSSLYFFNTGYFLHINALKCMSWTYIEKVMCKLHFFPVDTKY